MLRYLFWSDCVLVLPVIAATHANKSAILGGALSAAGKEPERREEQQRLRHNMGGAESSFIVVASWVSSSLRSPRLHLPPSRERSRSFTVCVTSVLSGGSCLGRELCFQEEIRLCNLTVGGIASC